MNQLIQCKAIILSVLIGVVLAYFGLSSKAEAVLPAPDGGYPSGNTAEGQSALLSLTTGGFNTAVGWFSLRSDTGGSYNTAIGAGALISNTTGVSNTAIGVGALLFNTSGGGNTATGVFALASNTADNNTAHGVAALGSNTAGSQNTAIGAQSLGSNTSGSGNTASGFGALQNNTYGLNNTANGLHALLSNGNGNINTAIGSDALRNHTTGGGNTAIGGSAMQNHTTGDGNTAIGYTALVDSSGSNNVALGAAAGANVLTASHVICIGANGEDVSNTCFIGNIFGVTTGMDAVSVVVDANGQLGTIPCSRRFKRDIQPMDKTSEAIFSFKPVTFHYKNGKKETRQFGLIAEDVAQVNPDLVVRDKNGEIYSVRYDAVNAMLLNEFLKEHRKVEKLEALVAQQHKDFEAALTDLKGQIQRVSAQLELSKPAPQTVLNNQ